MAGAGTGSPMQGGGFAGATGGFNPAGGPMNVGAPGTTKIKAPMGAPIQPVKPLPGQVPQPIAPQPMAPAAAPQGDIFQQASTGIGQAMGGAQRELGFMPSQVRGMGYRAPDIASQIQAFQNPYEQQVVQGAMGDIERQRQMQANQLAAQFQGARAFGGSREAIQQAELGRQALEQGASTSAALRQQGFGQALQSAAQQAQMGQRASEFGLNQNLQAQLANQAARQRFGEFGAGQSLQAQLANQSARARANEFGLGQNLQAQLANQAARQAGSQQRLSAASQLGSLANLGFGMGQTVQNQMAQQGALQQQLQQQIMNAARSQFEGFRNYPAQALGYYAQALGATPTPQSSTTSKQPGLFDYLTLGASLMG